MQADRPRRTPSAGWMCRSVLGLSGLVLAALPAGAMPCTNMTLVLAIDGSGSIGDAEFAYQLAATARAITAPEVVAAMAAVGGVAVTALIWGDSGFGVHRLDWVEIFDPASAERFAATLAAQPRLVTGDTDMGYAISAALDLIGDPANCASYNVIDVSGDGRETLYANRRGISLAVARQRAEDQGVVINGLAISTVDPRLADYYHNHVISGPGAFVVETTTFAGFGDAMRRKLLSEVRGYAQTQVANAATPEAGGG